MEDNNVEKYKSIPRAVPCGMSRTTHIPFSGRFDQHIPEQRLLTRIYMDSFISMSEKCTLDEGLEKWDNLYPLLWTYQQDIQNQKDLLRQKQLQQQKTNYAFTCFLPDILFEQSIATLSNTGSAYRDEYLRSGLRQFRGQVFEYLNSKKAFTEKFFTQLPKEQWQENWDDYTATEKDIYGNRENYPRLSFVDVPDFNIISKFQVGEGFPILLGANILLFFIGLGLFQTIKR